MMNEKQLASSTDGTQLLDSLEQPVSRLQVETRPIDVTSTLMGGLVGAAIGLFGMVVLISLTGVRGASVTTPFLPLITAIFMGGIGVLFGSIIDLHKLSHSAADSLRKFDDFISPDK